MVSRNTLITVANNRLSGIRGGTFRLQTNGIDWVARYYGTEKTALFVRAKKESSILKQLLNTQLAPNIIKRHGAWFFSSG